MTEAAKKIDPAVKAKMDKVSEQGSRVFERIEGTLDRCAEDLPKLRDVITEGHALGMCGMMRKRTLLATVGEIQGKQAELDAMVTKLHETCTKIAKDNGADVAEPEGGGSR